MGKGSAANGNGGLANNSTTGSANITETRPQSLLEYEQLAYAVGKKKNLKQRKIPTQ